MADRIDALIQRSRMGDVGLTPEEKEELKNALYGLAPSSERYKTIMSVLGKPRGPVVSNYRSPNQNEDGTWKKINQGPTFQGPPTLDFLNLDHQGMIDMPEGPAARGWDASGAVYSMLPEPTEGATRSRAGDNWFNFEGGGGLVANPGLDDNNLPNTLRDQYLPEEAFPEQPEGYSWSGMSPGMLTEFRDDPQMLAALMAKQGGASAGTEAFIAPFVQAASSLQAQGVLGGNTVDDTIFGGARSSAEGLREIEDFTNFVNTPGNQFVDSGELYSRSFDRAMNTDFTDYSNPDGTAYSNDDIIAITNIALMSSAPFVSRDGQAVMSAKLARAGVEYKLALATGEIGDISYPEYLKTLGADQWMG